jgi:hypothetical protein
MSEDLAFAILPIEPDVVGNPDAISSMLCADTEGLLH